MTKRIGNRSLIIDFMENNRKNENLKYFYLISIW